MYIQWPNYMHICTSFIVLLLSSAQSFLSVSQYGFPVFSVSVRNTKCSKGGPLLVFLNVETASNQACHHAHSISFLQAYPQSTPESVIVCSQCEKHAPEL